jgi:hypothetical protein
LKSITNLGKFNLPPRLTPELVAVDDANNNSKSNNGKIALLIREIFSGSTNSRGNSSANEDPRALSSPPLPVPHITASMMATTNKRKDQTI